jgi:hypothetical protein
LFAARERRNSCAGRSIASDTMAISSFSVAQHESKNTGGPSLITIEKKARFRFGDRIFISRQNFELAGG